jgi:hypothetical protein
MPPLPRSDGRDPSQSRRTLQWTTNPSHADDVVGLRVRGQSLRRWGIALAAWSAVGVFAVVHAAWTSKLNGGHPGWRMVVAWMANMWLWALFTGSLCWWARRFPMERERWLVHLVAHGALSLVYSAASTAFNMAFAAFALEPLRSSFGTVYVGELFYNVASYGAVVVIAHALVYARQLTERRMRAMELEHELTRAQLGALEMQLRPHFLFNTLHSVAGMIRGGDPDGAIQMIGGLGDLLRTVLDDDRAQELPLTAELELAELYLEIERIRFADRLRVAFEISPAARDALVPRLVLQPLLENAIRHGVQTREEGGAVTVRATCRDQTLELEVVDSSARLDLEPVAGIDRAAEYGVSDGVRDGVGHGHSVSGGLGRGLGQSDLGRGVSDGAGDGVSGGAGDGVSDGAGDGVSGGAGDGVSDGAGDGVSGGPGDGVSDDPGHSVSDGLGRGVSDGPGRGVSDGPGRGVSDGPGHSRNPGVSYGAGRDIDQTTGHGIGLQNTRDRLRHLYGAAQRLDLERQADGGTLVRISLPLRRSCAEVAA